MSQINQKRAGPLCFGIPGTVQTRFRSTKFLMTLIKQTRINIPNGILYINKGASPEINKKNRCCLNLRINYFSQRVIDQWIGLPINLVTASSLNAFKSRTNGFWKDHPFKILSSLLPHGGPSQTGKTTKKSIHRCYLA